VLCVLRGAIRSSGLCAMLCVRAEDPQLSSRPHAPTPITIPDLTS
jgi:hypothetical protein